MQGDVAGRPDTVDPLIREAHHTRQPTLLKNQQFLLDRHDYVEEVFAMQCYSLLPGDSGGASGVLVAAAERTDQIVDERRLRTLHDLATSTAGRGNSAAERHLGHVLAAAAEIKPGEPAAPQVVELGDADAVSPLGRQLPAAPGRGWSTTWTHASGRWFAGSSCCDHCQRAPAQHAKNPGLRLTHLSRTRAFTICPLPLPGVGQHASTVSPEAAVVSQCHTTAFAARGGRRRGRAAASGRRLGSRDGAT